MTALTLAKATRVMRKAHKHLGVEHPATPTEYLVSIVKGKSIQIYRERDGKVEVCRKFEIGDEAEYDSFNLSYLGEIESITDKSVTIVKKIGVSNKKHRLDLNTFCWRNYNFNAAETARKNHEEMMYL